MIDRPLMLLVPDWVAGPDALVILLADTTTPDAVTLMELYCPPAISLLLKLPDELTDPELLE